MTIIAGLGNPDKKYSNTPHNIGFEALDYFVENNDFPAFEFSKIFNAMISKKDDAMLVKPQTYMNNSGFSIKKICRGRTSVNLIVIHDDIDLPLGKIRVSKNRGSAGHKGVESIIKELGTKDFTRVRIGISPQSHTLNYGTEKYVLKKFNKKDKEIIQKSFNQVSSELKKLIK